MSTDIEGIKKWFAENPQPDYRAEEDIDPCYTVAQMRVVMAELEKAEEERKAARDTLKRAHENWEKLAEKAAANLARVEQERHAERERADILASDIEAADIALDLTDAEGWELSLVDRIEALQRNERRLQELVRSATAAETLKRLPTISDPEIHEAMMEVERAFSNEEEK